MIRSCDGCNQWIAVIHHCIAAFYFDFFRLRVNCRCLTEGLAVSSKAESTGRAFFPTCRCMCMRLCCYRNGLRIIFEGLCPLRYVRLHVQALGPHIAHLSILCYLIIIRELISWMSRFPLFIYHWLFWLHSKFILMIASRYCVSRTRNASSCSRFCNCFGLISIVSVVMRTSMVPSAVYINPWACKVPFPCDSIMS